MTDPSPFHQLIEYAWRNSPFYRELYTNFGIREKDLPELDVQDLPLVTKELLMENFDEVVTDRRIQKKELLNWLETDRDPEKKYLEEFTAMYSSGGSATLGISAYDRQAWRSMTSVAASYLWPYNMDERARVRSAFYFSVKGHYASTTSASQVSSRFIQPLILTLADPLEDVLAQLAAFRPQRLTSYASGAAFLARLTLEGKLPIAPREVVISGDRLTPGMEASIQAAWKPRLYDIYAAVESLYIGIRQPGNDHWTLFDELNILECLNNENRPVPAGARGRAILTNTYNYTIPFIRYDLTDHVIPGEPVDGHPTLQAILGKTHDGLPVRLDDGGTGKIPSYKLADFNLAGVDLVQFITHSPDKIEIEYCGKAGLEQPIRQAFTELLASHGAGVTEFTVKRVEHIWNSLRGSKFKLIRRPEDVPIILQPSISLVTPRPEIKPQNPFSPFPPELLESNIASCFEMQAARRPQALAIRSNSKTLTYAQLNRIANRIASALIKEGAGPAHPIALLFGHKPAMVAAILGVLKAGGFYLPLDPTFPERRNASILEDAHAGILLTDREGLSHAHSVAGPVAKIINLDALDVHGGDENPGLPIRPDAPACILYTSGSTGAPKGVLLDQRAILHRVMLYTNDYHISADDRLSLLQFYIYSASTRDIFGALLNGAGLYLFDTKDKGAHALADWLIKGSISVLYCVPTVFRALLAALDGEVFSALRLIRLGGEAPTPMDVEGFQRHFGSGCILVNALATTETETLSQYYMDHTTRVAGNSVPVGYAVAGKEISLLDETGGPVGDGTVGEIVVSSAFMGPGYWPDRVTETGIPQPTPGADHQNGARSFHTGDLGFRLPDGRITLTGRTDWTVKVRGQRINLAEIELRLNNIENIEQAVVVSHSAPDGSSSLAAYIKPVGKPAPQPESIRKALVSYLPIFMIPSVFIFMDEMPLTPGGKIDRLALPLPGDGRASTAIEIVPPATPQEEILLEIWKVILKLNEISVDDNFFSLGGDSLQAAAMMWKVDAKFNQKLPISVLVHYDTIRKLAGLLSEADDPNSSGDGR